jgi:hypothetical protein
LLNLGFAGGAAVVVDPWIVDSQQENIPRTGTRTQEYMAGTFRTDDTLIPRPGPVEETPLKRP